MPLQIGRLQQIQTARVVAAILADWIGRHSQIVDAAATAAALVVAAAATSAAMAFAAAAAS